MNPLLIVVGGLVAVLVALGVILWRRNRPKPDLLAELGPAPKDVKTYDDVNYDADKEKYKAVKKDVEEKKTTDPKFLQKALFERAIASIDKIRRLQADSQEITSSRSSNLCPEEVWQSYMKAQQRTEVEFNEVKQEAEDIKKEWGEKIYKEAVEIWTAQKRKEMRKEMEKKAVKDKAKEEKKKKKAEEHKLRLDKEAEERKAKLAEKRFLELLEEEDRAKAKSSKKNKSSTKSKSISQSAAETAGSPSSAKTRNNKKQSSSNDGKANAPASVSPAAAASSSTSKSSSSGSSNKKSSDHKVVVAEQQQSDDSAEADQGEDEAEADDNVVKVQTVEVEPSDETEDLVDFVSRLRKRT